MPGNGICHGFGRLGKFRHGAVSAQGQPSIKALILPGEIPDCPFLCQRLVWIPFRKCKGRPAVPSGGILHAVEQEVRRIAHNAVFARYARGVACKVDGF